jgi:hypothetical protein
MLAVGADPQQATPPNPGARPQAAGQQGMMPTHLDGTGTILCAEKDGQRMNAGHNDTVTIRGNVLTWRKDGKEHNVRLQFSGNHMVFAHPENEEHGRAPGQAGTAERKGQPAATEGTRGEREQPGEKREAAGQPATGQTRGEHPATAAPAPVPGQLQIPGQLPGAQTQFGQPNPAWAAQGRHHGVYIFADDFLCLAFDRGLPGGANERAKPGSTRPGEPAATSPPGGRVGQPATPGVAGSGTQPGAAGAAPGTNPGAGTADRPRTGGTPEGTTGTEQRTAGTGHETGGQRVANYGGDTMHNGSVVLILRREKGEQHSGQEK